MLLTGYWAQSHALGLDGLDQGAEVVLATAAHLEDAFQVLDGAALHEHLVAFCKLLVGELHEFDDGFGLAEALVDEADVALEVLGEAVGLCVGGGLLWSALTTETRDSLISVMSICSIW